eukprot:3294763-Rhodomonas_salina.2
MRSAVLTYCGMLRHHRYCSMLWRYAIPVLTQRLFAVLTCCTMLREARYLATPCAVLTQRMGPQLESIEAALAEGDAENVAQVRPAPTLLVAPYATAVLLVRYLRVPTVG